MVWCRFEKNNIVLVAQLPLDNCIIFEVFLAASPTRDVGENWRGVRIMKLGFSAILRLTARLPSASGLFPCYAKDSSGCSSNSGPKGPRWGFHSVDPTSPSR
ncbi:uncharacterized protein LOC107261044 isoform X2 [Ricinus communis]|uniref:uncharacterized protein LOC107261044 isoform X2 n=1 Tax=Ricinus communis TaxID=3988 RepID=UPI000772D298|nr:uncharacterized protein LOC107261044 isoform X2 [Ricinus communis]|eukprot:XP_015573046.1 uncharacterized protein LOC107261044 [Ricinus communis]